MKILSGVLNLVALSTLTATIYFYIDQTWIDKTPPARDILPLAVISCFFLYFFYLYDCYEARAHMYLNGPILLETAEEYMHKIQDQKPVVRFNIECFHYGLRNAKITTFTDSEVFWYKNCIDKTTLPALSSAEAVAMSTRHNPVTILECTKMVMFADHNTHERFYKQMESLQTKHCCRDKHTSVTHDIQIEGFVDQAVVYDDVIHPWWLNLYCYWMFAFLLLGSAYRILFDSVTNITRITVTKVIDINSENSTGVNSIDSISTPSTRTAHGSTPNTPRTTCESL